MWRRVLRERKCAEKCCCCITVPFRPPVLHRKIAKYILPLPRNQERKKPLVRPLPLVSPVSFVQREDNVDEAVRAGETGADPAELCSEWRDDALDEGVG